MGALTMHAALLTENEEREVIAACVVYPNEAIPLVTARPEDFCHPDHAATLRAALRLFRGKQPISEATTARAVADDTGRPIGDVMRGLIEVVAQTSPSPFTVRHHCSVITARAAARGALSRLNLARTALESGDNAEGLRLLGDAVGALTGVGSEADEPQTLGQAAADALELAEKVRTTGKRPGMPTGIRSLDETTGGLRAPRLYIVGARPGHGKTALAMQMGVTAARHGKRVLFCSMEMKGVELGTRTLAAESGCVTAQELDRGEHRHEDTTALVEAVESLQGLPFWIEDRPALKISQIEHRARYLKARHGLDLIFVDYLQLARPDQRHVNREGAVAEISRGLKAIAKALDVAVVSLAQLNRECDKRADHRPIRSDLRGSGQLEQDADLIGFLYRPGVYRDTNADPRLAELIIDKHRQGTPRVLNLDFDGPAQTFRDAEQVPW